MKKFIIFLFFLSFILMPSFMVEAFSILPEYRTYPEIIMSTGKLLSNFTEAELKEIKKQTQKNKFYGVVVQMANTNVKASYVSEIVYAYTNSGDTSIILKKEYSITTSKTTAYSFSDNLSAEGSGTLNKIKVAASAKTAITYNKKVEEVVKETEKMDIEVEPNSRMVMYMTGELTISNGYATFYSFWLDLAHGGFEIVVLNSQYPVIEKTKINTTKEE